MDLLFISATDRSTFIQASASMSNDESFTYIHSQQSKRVGQEVRAAKS